MLVLFYDNCDVITVNIILEGCNVSHCTHPIGINQETSLISTQTCQGSGWGGGVTGDKKERLLLSRKERKISCLITPVWGGLCVRGGLSAILSPRQDTDHFMCLVRCPRISVWSPFIGNSNREKTRWEFKSMQLKYESLYFSSYIWFKM